MKRRYLYYFLPILGTIFGLWYIFASTCDGIYSDYIRLVNSYLPDVWNPRKFFVPDILTRIPVNYIGRIMNIYLFGYNTMFDRVLGVLALGLSGWVLTSYCIRRKIPFHWFFLLMVVIFSLNKWEMLTNGSGWAHFLAFACFYYHYDILDRVWSGEEKEYDRPKLVTLPFVTTLLVAGSYCGIYSVTVILFSGFLFLFKKKKEYLLYGVSTLVPLLLYLWSNEYAVEDHAAAATGPMIDQLIETPGFFVRFFVKSFSSMIIGGERAEEIFPTNLPFMALGLLVIGLYLIAIWCNLKYRIYEKTIMPLILIVSGGLNHVLIVASRWIFLQENYGISSRYALQFQTGILGILLTLSLLLTKRKRRPQKSIYKMAIFTFGLFLIGNAYTTYIEVKKAPYRLEHYERRAELSLHFEQLTDDELRESFEYRKSQIESGQKVRAALTILKENGYGVFRSVP